VFSLCVFILCIYAASRTARRLYSPLGEIVRRFIPQNAGAVNDEFEILRTNSRKMELLSQELQKTIEENEALAVQKYNRGLLEGIVSEEDAKNTDVFFVASVILTAEEGTAERDRRPYVQLCAEACSIGEEGIHYVQYGIKEFALILDCADETEAKEKLNDGCEYKNWIVLCCRIVGFLATRSRYHHGRGNSRYYDWRNRCQGSTNGTLGSFYTTH